MIMRLFFILFSGAFRISSFSFAFFSFAAIFWTLSDMRHFMIFPVG